MFITKLAFYRWEGFSQGQPAAGVGGCFGCWLCDKNITVLVMCEGWKGFEGEPKEPVKQLSWISPWRIESFPSTPAAKM